MRSAVWDGDCPLTQPYGCTDLAVEPYDARCASKHWHCGVDVGMPIGTPLRAARGGEVIAVSYGLLAIKAGLETDWYVHIEGVAVAVKVGVRVTAGQQVALSGARVPQGGSLTGPHLHFEVQRGRLNDPATSVDPVPILSAVNHSEKRALARLAYVAGLGREPESEAVLEGWAIQIADDGSNVDPVIASIIDSAEGQKHLAAISKTQTHVHQVNASQSGPAE